MNLFIFNSKELKLILKLLIIAAAVVISFLIFYIAVSPEYIDIFYVRFITPRQSSLILGDSRAAQGLVPSVINQSSRQFSFFNYAFTASYSPFCEDYLISIKEKLTHNIEGQMFIISIGPTQFTSYETTTASNTSSYLSSIKSVNGNGFINISYFMSVNRKPLIYGLFNRVIGTAVNHRDGWLQQRLVYVSPGELEERYTSGIIRFENSISARSWDNLKWNLFCDLIDFLKDSGAIVFLIRMPTSNDVNILENRYFPDFNERFYSYSLENQIIYLDHSGLSNSYNSIDGNHLTEESAIDYSEYLSVELLKYL